MPLPTEQRLFLALWPDAALATHLQRIARPLIAACPAARPVPAARIHMTLAFLGSLVPERRAACEAALADLVVPKMCIELGHLGCWPKPGILWVAPTAGSDPLLDLVAELRERLNGCGQRLERRRFRPHLTLARRCHALPHRPESVALNYSWAPTHVYLVASERLSTGACYTRVAAWPAGA